MITLAVEKTANTERWAREREERHAGDERIARAVNQRIWFTSGQKAAFDAAGASPWFRKAATGLTDRLPPPVVSSTASVATTADHATDGSESDSLPEPPVQASVLVSPAFCLLFDDLGGINWLRAVLEGRRAVLPAVWVKELLAEITAEVPMERDDLAFWVKGRCDGTITETVRRMLVERLFAARFEQAARPWVEVMDKDWRLLEFTMRSPVAARRTVAAYAKNAGAALERFCDEYKIEIPQNTAGLAELLYFRDREFYRIEKLFHENPALFNKYLRKVNALFFTEKNLSERTRTGLGIFALDFAENLQQTAPSAPGAFAFELFTQMRTGVRFTA